MAGKTGTTQMPGMNEGNKDNWFVGYTPQLVGAVWLGYDKTDAHHFLRTAAGDSAAIIFREMMSRALQDQPAKAFRLDTIHLSKPPKIDRSPKPKPQTPEEKAAKKIKEGLKDLWKSEEKRLKERLRKKKKNGRNDSKSGGCIDPVEAVSRRETASPRSGSSPTPVL